MKITRLPPEPQQLTEAKTSSPHLSGQSTDQLLNLWNRKHSHVSRDINRGNTAVFQAMGYSYDSAVYVVPLFTDKDDLKKYWSLASATESANCKKFYLAPNDYFVEYTNLKYGEGYSNATNHISGKRKLVVGNKDELSSFGLDEEDFQEYADFVERYETRSNGPASSLKSQITRLTKKQTDDLMASKAAQQQSAPVVNAPTPPSTILVGKGKPANNPYYTGSKRYNGYIGNTPWQTTAMKNMMNTYTLALDMLGEPLSIINHSADAAGGTDYFYAKSQNGVFVFYVTGPKSGQMKVIINGTSYSLRSPLIANKPKDTALQIQKYYWQGGNPIK